MLISFAPFFEKIIKNYFPDFVSTRKKAFIGFTMFCIMIIIFIIKHTYTKRNK